MTFPGGPGSIRAPTAGAWSLRPFPEPGRPGRVHASMGKRRPARPSNSAPRTLHGAVVVAEVDLHGLDVERAEDRVESFLRTWSVREPGGVVRIITGRGAGSHGPAVLREAIRVALSGWAGDWVVAWSVEQGGGAYLARLRG